MTQIVQPDSLLTLHYRISLDSGQSLISTFETTPRHHAARPRRHPADPQRCLAGIAVGDATPSCSAETPSAPTATNWSRRSASKTSPTAPRSSRWSSWFTAPDGTRYPGLIREVATHATIDFNHPLAGKAIRFEVRVIGIN